MTINAGIWIDHHKAVVVLLSDQGEEVLHFLSDHKATEGKQSHSPSDFVAEDKRDRKVMIRLDKYYDEVFNRVHGADTILVFGPGEAKGEFKHRIASKKFKGQVAELETTDKLTDPQIAAHVREHFHKT